MDMETYLVFIHHPGTPNQKITFLADNGAYPRIEKLYGRAGR